MSELAIDVQDLCKSFDGKIAVDHVSIQQPKGSVWGFLGPNGSGKTTTIRLICGLLVPDSGQGQCLGFDILKNSREIKNHTGYMTQKFSFWEDLTIRENLEFVARLYGLNKGIVDQTIDILGLTKRQLELTKSLSGGWKQRMALAAVTMHHPKLLLLDEPTAGVDPQARRDFWAEIHRLSQEEGMTVLVSTHYMDEAERCDKIVYLAYGHLVIQGGVNEIIEQSGLKAYHCNTQEDYIRSHLPNIQALDGIDSAIYANATLHFCTENEKLALASLKQYNDQLTAKGNMALQWEKERPSLDDTFIALEKRTGGDQR